VIRTVFGCPEADGRGALRPALVCASGSRDTTFRKVIGFMSDNHIDPDLAVEVFVLEPLPSADAR
jgi:hypothetical protein